MPSAVVTRKTFICLLVFLLFGGIGTYWTRLGQALYTNEQRFYMSELVNGQASAIERRLTRSLSATRILAQAVRQNGGAFAGFDDYAAEVLRSVDGISNLQLAPGGVVRHVYPLAGNEAVLGHDILADEQRRSLALQAIEERRLTLAGPLNLIQGGVGLIGRNPVFLSGPDGETFWGFASALVSLRDLLRVTELDPEGRKGYSYELSRNNPTSGEREVFSRSSTPLTKDSYAVDLEVPGATWQLVMSRSTPTPKWRSTTGYIASLLAGLLTAWVAYILLRQPERLRQIVKEKTYALERLAFHDHLTELANRRQLSEQLDRVVREHERYRQPAALMYLDLDDFKRVNDTQGHDAGDALLRKIAERLRGCVRTSDLVARLGGDEFGILLLDAESVRDVSRIAEKLIETVERPVVLGSRAVNVSTSVGITLFPADGDSVAAIMSNADMAMYAAKKAGKRNFSFYDRGLQAEALARMQLEEDLNEAIAREEFVLHYQPIIDLKSGETRGYEALIRWQHPRDGLLYPDRFICLAEETGKITQIGYWVIREACRQLKASDVAREGRFGIAINLSPKQFKDPLLLDNIRRIVEDAGIEARRLEIEVTESCVMENVDEAVATLRQLREIGVSAAIDDFGTGYSSLALLKQLPVERLKIDKSFVQDLETDPSDKKIVQALISMSHKLQLKVVAEGIETSEQRRLLKGYGCDLGQGFLISRPAPWPVQIKARKASS
ncbi:bifunctional diguanylate cyclase/phosphodiesterase [Motiliproteus sp. SC1-56]|uniref:putative bifunctional diguanylate cyclase/phosphodiesterase n=1 Tax=Motiliproteus sp. SC1-56 TaxID=2799565 RepID=UPI001A90A259|nr:EAL domain-containing protein [Motiliproteus sp. SC1-56]